ncbi:hypothetical protein ACFU1Q_11325 [Brachybacterium paraconglomeratum]
MSETSQLLEQLRGHYIPETTQPGARRGGVFAHEVSPNGAWGGPGVRRADALYAGFTSASGRILVGHELKVSRADWRAELAKVGKADAWADACHQWWIVAPSTDVVPPEELPDGWGLMLPPRSARGRRMQTAVKARVKVDHSPPWWAVRSFMARLETLEHEQRHDEIQRIVQAQVEERTAYLKKREAPAQMSLEDKHRLDDLGRLEKELDFELSSFRSVLEKREVSVRDFQRALRLAAATGTEAARLANLRYSIGGLQDAANALAKTIPEIERALAGSGEAA